MLLFGEGGFLLEMSGGLSGRGEFGEFRLLLGEFRLERRKLFVTGGKFPVAFGKRRLQLSGFHTPAFGISVFSGVLGTGFPLRGGGVIGDAFPDLRVAVAFRLFDQFGTFGNAAGFNQRLRRLPVEGTAHVTVPQVDVGGHPEFRKLFGGDPGLLVARHLVPRKHARLFRPQDQTFHGDGAERGSSSRPQIPLVVFVSSSHVKNPRYRLRKSGIFPDA